MGGPADTVEEADGVSPSEPTPHSPTARAGAGGRDGRRDVERVAASLPKKEGRAAAVVDFLLVPRDETRAHPPPELAAGFQSVEVQS